MAIHGLEKYDNPKKTHWRYWLWKRIKAKLDKPANKATALYLVGPEDHDRDVAIKNGFRAENLIAVDVDSHHVANVRSNGQLAVQLPLQDVLYGWNDEPVDVVVADLCCGLTELSEDINLKIVIGSPAIRIGTVIAINHLRGRESGIAKEWFDNETRRMRSVPETSRKHRGMRWGIRYVGDVVALNLWIEHREVPLRDIAKRFPSKFVKEVERLLDWSGGITGSYRSGCQVFDTLVMKCVAENDAPVEWDDGDTVKSRDEIIGKLRALKAVRTNKGPQLHHRYWEQKADVEA